MGQLLVPTVFSRFEVVLPHWIYAVYIKKKKKKSFAVPPYQGIPEPSLGQCQVREVKRMLFSRGLPQESLEIKAPAVAWLSHMTTCFLFWPHS